MFAESKRSNFFGAKENRTKIRRLEPPGRSNRNGEQIE
jgi:hypothetical protein